MSRRRRTAGSFRHEPPSGSHRPPDATALADIGLRGLDHSPARPDVIGSPLTPAAQDAHVRIQTADGEDSGITVTWKRPANPLMSWAFCGPWRCEQLKLGDGITLPNTILHTQPRSSAAQAAQWLRIQLYAQHVTLGAHRADALEGWLSDPYVQRLPQHLEAHGLAVMVAIAHTAGTFAWRVGSSSLEEEIASPVKEGAS